MTNQLSVISKSIGEIGLIEKYIIPEIFELLKDEEIKVSVSAMESLVQILDMIPIQIKKDIILPLLKDYMVIRPGDLELEMQKSLSMTIGSIIIKVLIKYIN